MAEHRLVCWTTLSASSHFLSCTNHWELIGNYIYTSEARLNLKSTSFSFLIFWGFFCIRVSSWAQPQFSHFRFYSWIVGCFFWSLRGDPWSHCCQVCHKCVAWVIGFSLHHLEHVLLCHQCYRKESFFKSWLQKCMFRTLHWLATLRASNLNFIIPQEFWSHTVTLQKSVLFCFFKMLRLFCSLCRYKHIYS